MPTPPTTPTNFQFSDLRAAYFKSAADTPEARETQRKEMVIFSLADGDYQASKLILDCSARIQNRCGTNDYPAAVDLALFSLSVAHKNIFGRSA